MLYLRISQHCQRTQLCLASSVQFALERSVRILNTSVLQAAQRSFNELDTDREGHARIRQDGKLNREEWKAKVFLRLLPYSPLALLSEPTAATAIHPHCLLFCFSL